MSATFDKRLYDTLCVCGHPFGWYEDGASFDDGSPLEEANHYRSFSKQDICMQCGIEAQDETGDLPDDGAYLHRFEPAPFVPVLHVEEDDE